MWPAFPSLADATSMMKIDNDGYIRLCLGDLQSVELVHLLSGLDEADCVDPACTDRAEIHGYTEWISASEPVVSVGWDWRVDTWARPVSVVFDASPRSNIMLLDGDGEDMGPEETARSLAVHLRALPWQPVVLAAIGFGDA